MQEDLIRFDKTSNFLFLDYETEGLCLSPRFNKPWQMALMNTVNGQKTDFSDTWIKWPNFKFSKGAKMMAKSYSSEKMDEIGVSPEEALEILDAKLQKCDYLIGHNILGFDLYILLTMYKCCGRPAPKLPQIIDTFPIAKGIVNNIPYQPGDDFDYYQYKLINEIIKGSKTSVTAMCKYYNIEIDEARTHQADYDLELTSAIWNKLKYQILL